MRYCLYTYAVLRIRAGVAVFHLAAQLIQHFVQCVGGQAADGIGHGFVGLLAQGGAGGQLYCIILPVPLLLFNCCYRFYK